MTASPLGFLHELKMPAVSPWYILLHHHPHHQDAGTSLRGLLVRTKGPPDVTLRDSASSPSSLPTTQPAFLLYPLRTRRCSFAHQAAILDTPTSVPKISLLCSLGGGVAWYAWCVSVLLKINLGVRQGTAATVPYMLLPQQKG